MRSKKTFNEVFPAFNTQDEEIKEQLSDVYVERVTTNPERTKVGVYIESPHTIHKKILMKTERELKGMFPPETKVSFRIHEHFVLSGTYTAGYLMEEYENSILYEMKVYQPILFGLFKSAQRKFNENGEYEIILPDTVIAHNMSGELDDFMHHVFNERCGVNIDLKIGYKYEEKSEIRQEAESRLRQEIEEISGRLAGSKKNDEPVRSKESAGTKSKTQRNTQNYVRHEKKSYARKNSDDPDVIFKSDVPEKAMDIADIEGQMNDIVIRGMVVSYSDRPISQGERMLVKFHL